MRIYTIILLLCLLAGPGTSFEAGAQQKKAEPVALSWLHEYSLEQPLGVSWGVPWPRGAFKKEQQFILTDASGENLPLQSWPLAYWPDGSLKWSAFATVASPEKGKLKLIAAKTAVDSPSAGLHITEDSRLIRINTGALQCIIPRSGRHIMDSLLIDNRVVGSRGRLECILQQGPDGEVYESAGKKRYHSKIEQVKLEQQGAVRAVVRVQGVLQEEAGPHSWLPFDIRLYFYAGSPAVRIVNTITYDGDDQKDFIRGLGLVFDVPMRDQNLYNRHVRFAGEAPGIWAEPVKPLTGRRGVRLGNRDIFPEQVQAKPLPPVAEFGATEQALIRDMPVWNDYKLLQHNADGFTIQKRTNANSSWIDANAGRRATGLAFVGDVTGGLAIGLKDFWQSYPAALEIRNAGQAVAELKAWLWSPYAEAMDMRHYDTVAHGLEATYEDVQEGLSTPYGVARTSELTLFASAGVPDNRTLSNLAKVSSNTPLLVSTPEYLHSLRTFGVWSLPDRSTPGKIWMEEQLDKAVNFYQKEIDQRNWYGFWNYGDVMHTYDPVRHSWRYDIGGYAWDNTELASDSWLWYSFLRSGRVDVFKMAEAMARHTSEVDVYHLGELRGLGSRHNVRHWGDGSKEVRESQAASRRFYYYLTTDERTGDIMREVAQHADLSMSRLDPLRLILPKMQYPTHARFGPDWLALAGNWMTEWERTGDKRWRDKILTGINSFSKMPYGFYSGAQGAFGYDPASQKMYHLNDEPGYSHLSVLMGGPEVAFELSELLENAKWNKMWLQYCSLWGAQPAEIQKAFGKAAELGRQGPWYARLPAYVAHRQRNPAMAALAWNWLLTDNSNALFDAVQVDAFNSLKPLQEVPGISTNHTAQWCLNAIQLLELVGDQMPEEHQLWSSKR